MRKALTAILIPALFLGVSGCAKQESSATSGENEDNSSAAETADEHHEHPSHGPNGGDLIELGEEDYHAEFVHGDDDSITIYVLGSDAKTSVPIEAAEMTINVSHDGTPEQFKLAASPAEGDPEGKSSRFVSSDGELSEHLHEEGAHAKLVVDIAGTQFTGAIAHEHDAEHGHAHEHGH